MPVIDVDYHDDRNSMRYWWPRLSNLDVPTPDTKEIPLEANAGDGPPIEWDTEEVVDAIDSFETDKAFLRTDRKAANILHEGSYIYVNNSEHVNETTMLLLLQMSNMDFMPSSLFVREWLELDEYAKQRGDIVAPEVRVFIDDGEILCHHLRTTEENFGPRDDASEPLAKMNDLIDEGWEEIEPYAKIVADEFDDDGWSVDFVRTEGGEWYCTDMALYGLYYFAMPQSDFEGWKSISYHETGCPHNLEENPPDHLPSEPENARSEQNFKHPTN